MATTSRTETETPTHTTTPVQPIPSWYVYDDDPTLVPSSAVAVPDRVVVAPFSDNAVAPPRPLPSSTRVDEEGKEQQPQVISQATPAQPGRLRSIWYRYVLRRPVPEKEKAKHRLSYPSGSDNVGYLLKSSVDHQGYSPDSPTYWILEAGFSPPGSLPDLARDQYNHDRPPFLLRQVPKPIYKQTRRSGLEVKVDVTRVINGSHMGRDAVFVGLNVEHHVRKAKGVKVVVKLAIGGLGQNLTLDRYQKWPGGTEPFIRLFAPRTHYGTPNLVEQSTNLAFEGGLSPAVPTFGGANLSASTGRGTNTSLERRHVIRGWTRSGMESSAPTMYTLTAAENPITQDGIYDQLPIGLVIGTQSRPLLLSVSVEPDEGALNNVASGKPWSTPILIDKTDWLGYGLPQDLSRKMENWDLEVWSRLVQYPEDYQSYMYMVLRSYYNLTEKMSENLK